MPNDDITMEFDGGDEDDITTGDILEAPKNIKEDTAKMAYLAEKKANETPMDKNIQTQANQKSRLEETDKYQNQNQNQPLSQGVGDGLIGNSTDSTIFAKSPHQQVLDALLEAGSVDKVLADPTPMAVITGYGESAIQYSLRLWVKSENYWDVYFLVTQRVKTIFDEKGVNMTYPHLNVHLDK
jgi:small-conductance mechanosensitive channel